jgi:hypothetical protein
VPEPDTYQVENASLDGAYAAVDLDRQPRNSNGVIPSASQVLLINLSSGSIKQLDREADLPKAGGVQGRTIDGSLLWNGHVYWDVRTTYTDRTPTIRDYDLATGKTTVAGQGGGWIPRLLATGVTFDPQGAGAIAIPRALPEVVAAARLTSTNQLLTDGHAFVWVTNNRITWWAPGQARPTSVRMSPRVKPSLQAVGGHFVFFADEASISLTNFVLDLRTGAFAALPKAQPMLHSASGVVLGYGFVGAFKDSPTAVVRLDTRKLPELTC